MLEKVTFNKKPMKKAVYKEQWDELLAKLVVLQQQAHNEGVGLVVLFEGWNGAGKGSRISDLMYHLDARSTGVYVGLDLDPDTEREFVGRECGVTGFYPIMQPFWKALGERNSITFYDRGWYTAVIQHMLYNAPAKLLLPKKEERHYLDSVHDFEQQLLADGIRPDGILCGEDLTAAGVLKALLRAGIRVPGETAVVGYDNSTYARLCEPELTSVDNKPEQVALLCVQLLQSRIEHGEDYSSVTLQPELVQRQSS